ncbi:hypothetical protein RJ640_016843 [Escallonia rubra]|uniref:PGG domain-containing protein n=1 Tax=Escallonia rubra TaxID=112253 RepID=A0AA88S3S3_9ASTE|nr:hypothetical protein RJ640_016843 [Escallonia rubra]
MASSSSSSLEKYSYPTNVDVGSYVPVKLSATNYVVWRSYMVRLIEGQGLMGFLNGTIKAPPQKITVPDDSSTGTKEMGNEDYNKWKKTDQLLLGWIIQTLNEDFLVRADFLKTAKEMWAMLERKFGYQPHPDFIARLSIVISCKVNDTMCPVTAAELGERKNLSQYVPLYKAALAGDWDTTSTIIEKEPDAVRAIVTALKETALMVAVRAKKRNAFVKKLLEKMLLPDVALTELTGSTALHIAAVVGNIEAARLLVEKDPELPKVRNVFKALPIHGAASYGRREMVLYLFTVTEENPEQKPFEGESGGKLLRALISSGLYDIALYLLQRYRKLAWEDPSPLAWIAGKPSAFPSGTRFNIWQKLIYSCVAITLENFENRPPGVDIKSFKDTNDSGFAITLENFENRPPGVDNKSSKDTNDSGIWLISLNKELHIELKFAASSILKFHGIAVPQINHIRETKLKHTQAFQLVKLLCQETAKVEYSKAWSLLGSPLERAIVVGSREVVEEILESFPSAVTYMNDMQQNLMHVAILARRENVYNLIYQFGCGDPFIGATDTRMNNCLHLAGKLGPQPKLNLRANITETCCFGHQNTFLQEVEKFSSPKQKEQWNSERMTPAMVFTEAHKELVKDGEQWVKDTANSCTIVAALIVTVVFASAITLPGGNNGDTGLPIFTHKSAFVVFVISDALALFSSTSSLLMFLSILTSRYGEQDFLYALPKRLIIGLVTLFLSIISMMIAFTATVYMLLEYKGRWILAPMAVLSGLPVTIFMRLQFPLLLDLIKSTYKPGIFGKQSDRILY